MCYADTESHTLSLSLSLSLSRARFLFFHTRLYTLTHSHTHKYTHAYNAMRVCACVLPLVRRYEAGWTVSAHHGGGYAYRLAPVDGPLTEEAFRKMPLDFVGNSILRWGGEKSTWH